MITATPKQLRRAAGIKERIDALQSELDEILGNEIPVPFAEPRVRKKRRMTAAWRAALAAAQRARWARIKGTAPEAEPAKKGKRKRSAAWRAALSAATK